MHIISRKRHKNRYHRKENIVTIKKPSEKEIDDLIFASKVCKNSKSNALY